MTLGEAQSYLQGERDHLLFMSRGAGGTKKGEGRQELKADLKKPSEETMPSPGMSCSPSEDKGSHE